MQPESFRGARLRLARVFSGLSPADLAERAGVTRQYVHSLEIDGRSPSGELVKVLAFLLHVSPRFFYRSEAPQIAPQDCHFRKLKSAPAAAEQESVARGTLFDELVSRLDAFLKLPPPNFHPVEAKSDEEIETIAMACRKAWGLGEGPISNMCRVVEQCAGAVITTFRGVSEKVDAFSISRPRPIVVRNMSKESAARMRFDLAHELGHLILHSGLETGDERTEEQANRFASAFLLPKKSFVAEFPRTFPIHWQGLYALKARWKVSVAAMLRRAYDLGLLDPAQYRIANIQLAKRGEKKREMLDDTLPLEQPEWLLAALKLYEDRHGKSLRSLADELDVTPAFLRRLVGVDVPTSDDWESDASVVKLADYREGRNRLPGDEASDKSAKS